MIDEFDLYYCMLVRGKHSLLVGAYTCLVEMFLYLHFSKGSQRKNYPHALFLLE